MYIYIIYIIIFI